MSAPNNNPLVRSTAPSSPPLRLQDLGPPPTSPGSSDNTSVDTGTFSRCPSLQSSQSSHHGSGTTDGYPLPVEFHPADASSIDTNSLYPEDVSPTLGDANTTFRSSDDANVLYGRPSTGTIIPPTSAERMTPRPASPATALCLAGLATALCPAELATALCPAEPATASRPASPAATPPPRPASPATTPPPRPASPAATPPPIAGGTAMVLEALEALEASGHEIAPAFNTVLVGVFTMLQRQQASNERRMDEFFARIDAGFKEHSDKIVGLGVSINTLNKSVESVQTTVNDFKANVKVGEKVSHLEQCLDESTKKIGLVRDRIVQLSALVDEVEPKFAVLSQFPEGFAEVMKNVVDDLESRCLTDPAWPLSVPVALAIESDTTALSERLDSLQDSVRRLVEEVQATAELANTANCRIDSMRAPSDATMLDQLVTELQDALRKLTEDVTEVNAASSAAAAADVSQGASPTAVPPESTPAAAAAAARDTAAASNVMLRVHASAKDCVKRSQAVLQQLLAMLRK